MATKGGHILRSYLIFSTYLTLFCASINAQDSTLIKDTASVVILEKEEVNYPGRPLIMSLILPGAGQYYNKSPFWKTATFLGIELGSILAWRYYEDEAEKLKDDYQAFADLNWTMDNWVYNRFNSPPPSSDGIAWTNFPALRNLTGTHDLKLIITGDLANDLNITRVSSDSLDMHPEWFYSGDIIVVRDRHFYENIGKYDQFVGGWNDAREEWFWEEKDVGDSIEVVIKTPFKKDYINQRYSSNQMLSAAKYSITVLMFNHVISGIESVWTNQKNARGENKEASLKPKLDLVYNPNNPSAVGGIRLSVLF